MSQERPSSSNRSYGTNFNIPAKSNRILNLVLLAMVLIILRCWHLGVIQYEQRLEQSRRPQKRTILEPAKRATIRDRFNIPLAVNKVQYQATILYSQIKEVPSIVWKLDKETGKKVRILKRREYIKNLAELLAKELNLDADRLIDIIHAKTTLYGHVPYVIKEDITEKEYYRLKMLEKDWRGIHVRLYPKRDYPQGKVASNIIGYMGAINREEYESVMQEINSLKEFMQQLEDGKNPDLPEGMDSYYQVQKRLHDLQEKAYSINDYVGKSGIEGQFEEDMRGFHGKKMYHSDAKGNFLLELPGTREPIAGQRLLLTISSELQRYAEEILIKSEAMRTIHLSESDKKNKIREPWIKGGAIIAMDPENGEVLALASYPRFDPNDFVPCGDPEEKKKKQSNIACWFETDRYLGEIWNQKRPMEREVFDPKYGIVNEEYYLNWDQYLTQILPSNNSIIATFKKNSSIHDAIEVQLLVEDLIRITESKSLYHLFNTLYESDGHERYGGKVGAVAIDILNDKISKNKSKIFSIKQKLNKYFQQITSNYDKVLYLDLCRMVVKADLFSPSLIVQSGNQRLSSYRNASAAFSQISEVIKTISKDLFHDVYFKNWRDLHEKEYLKKKRAEEKEAKKFPKPYLDYLDKKEKKLFEFFWSRYRWQFISTFLMGQWMDYHPDEDIQIYLDYFNLWHKELQNGAYKGLPWIKAYRHLTKILNEYKLDIAIEYLQTLRSFEELDRPLLGQYRHLKKKNRIQLEKHLASGFYPSYGYGYARSHAYRQASTLGSIFKIVTAYEALVHQYDKYKDPNISASKLNPLTIDDRYYKIGKEEFVGYHENEKPIPRYYKGGRIPKSLSNNIGKLDIVKAIERSSNPYFALLAGDLFSDSEDLANAARKFSYGEKTGIELPLEIAGKVPDDLSENKTGLYATSIGQHSLVVTPLQAAVMLSTIANGGIVYQPKIVYLRVGRLPNRQNEILYCKPPFKYEEYYASVGVDFPLYTSESSFAQKSVIQKDVSIVKRTIFLPDQIRRILLEGMRRVVERSQQFAIGSLQNHYRTDPEAIRDFISIKGELIGKTSTAESIESVDLDIKQGTNKYNHLWFGGISFDSQEGKSKSFVFNDKFGKPELVVIVYLRYGAYGKDTMPIAAQVIKQWRKIKKRHAALHGESN